MCPMVEYKSVPNSYGVLLFLINQDEISAWRLSSLDRSIRVRLILRFDSCNLKVITLKYLININWRSLKIMLQYFFTCIMKNLLYL